MWGLSQPLLEKAEDVEDTLRIYESLSRIRGDIEQLKGQIQYLERTTSTSFIEIVLEPESSGKPLVRTGWNVLEVLKSSLRALVVAGQVIATLAIGLIVFIPIWGTTLGIIIWRVRKRKQANAEKQEQT